MYRRDNVNYFIDIVRGEWSRRLYPVAIWLFVEKLRIFKFGDEESCLVVRDLLKVIWNASPSLENTSVVKGRDWYDKGGIESVLRHEKSLDRFVRLSIFFTRLSIH